MIMFQIAVTGVTYEFDVNGWHTAHRLNLMKQVKRAAAAFAQAALLKIPVRTGFVAVAWSTLTDLLGRNARFNPIVPVIHRAEFYRGGGSKVLKSTTSGRLFATPSDQIFVLQGNELTFDYKVDIDYFRINDSVPGHAPTAPWQAFIEAKVAFEVSLFKDKAEFETKIEPFLKLKSVP